MPISNIVWNLSKSTRISNPYAGCLEVVEQRRRKNSMSTILLWSPCSLFPVETLMVCIHEFTRASSILYYYDRMFTLCYMLHLLFTGQDVHDLKLHVTEQENVHFEPKFTGWSIRPLADWVSGSEVGWAPKHILMRLPSCGAPTTPILCPRWLPICFESACVSHFQPNHEPEEGSLYFLRDIPFTALFTFLWKRDLDFFACLAITWFEEDATSSSGDPPRSPKDVETLIGQRRQPWRGSRTSSSAIKGYRTSECELRCKLRHRPIGHVQAQQPIFWKRDSTEHWKQL